MVLERAAKMAASAPDIVSNDTHLKTGMRLAADYMNGNDLDLNSEFLAQPEENQLDIRRGMAQILLRNIVLPRDEELQQTAQRALQAILSLSGNSADIGSICGELSQILDQYNQHREQTTQQLRDAIKSQLQQQQMAMGREATDDVNPASHPQYQEELTKIMTNLNGQYNDAMDQRKEMIMARFSPEQP